MRRCREHPGRSTRSAGIQHPHYRGRGNKLAVAVPESRAEVCHAKHRKQTRDPHRSQSAPGPGAQTQHSSCGSGGRRWMSKPGNNHHRTRVASNGNKRRIQGCDCRYSHLSLSRIFPPHMVANMAFTENTVSFPWPSLRKTGQELIPGKRGNNTRRRRTNALR